MTREEKLAKLKSKKMVVFADGQDLVDALKAQLNALQSSVDGGIDVNADDLLEELKQVGGLRENIDGLNKAIKELQFPELPNSVKVDGLNALVKVAEVLSKKEVKFEKLDTKPFIEVSKKMDQLIQKINTLKAPPQGQRPSDFIPTRRVMKVGNTLMYDDSHYTGGGGGGSNDFINQQNLPAQVKLTSDGKVPVDAVIETGDIEIGQVKIENTAGAAINPATKENQDTANTSLSSIKTDLDEIAIDTDNLATIVTNTGNAATSANQSTELTSIGGVTETAPATDTASSGLNGRLQRIAQRLTSILGVLPGSLGQKTKANSLPVTLASDQDALPITDNSGSLTVDGTVAVTNSDITTIAGAVRAEDAASADAQTGIGALAIRKATPGNTSGTDGDYEFLQMSGGRLWASATIDAALPAGANSIGTVDTELPAAAALADNLANPTTPIIGGANLLWNSVASQWERQKALTSIASTSPATPTGYGISAVALYNAATPTATPQAAVSATADGAGGGNIASIGNMVYNGSNFDRQRVVANATNSVGTGITAAGILGQFDDVSPTAISENSFGNLRMSNNRNLYGTIRDAAGNERGVNVDASNRLTVADLSAPAATSLNTYSARITTNTTTTPTSSTGYISSIVICVETAGTTSTLDIRDKSGTPIYLVRSLSTAAVLNNGDLTINFSTPIKMTSGIDIITAGSVAATIGVFINYYQ